MMINTKNKMKHSFFMLFKSFHVLSFALLTILLLIKCSENFNILIPLTDLDYRTIAYNSLSKKEKASIVGDYWRAKVTEGTYKSEDGFHIIVINENLRLWFILVDPATRFKNNQLLISVRFNTIDDPLLGPINVIIDPGSKTVVGSVVRY